MYITFGNHKQDRLWLSVSGKYRSCKWLKGASEREGVGGLTLSIKIGPSGFAYYENSVEERRQALDVERAEKSAGAEYYGTDAERPGVWIESKEGIAALYGVGAGTTGRGREEMAYVIDEAHEHYGLETVTDKDGFSRTKRTVYDCKNKQFDLTFSLPKSVSAIWADSPREVRQQIEALMLEAAQAGLADIAEHGLYVNRGSTPATQYRIKAEGLLAKAYIETTNRNGEPQLHTHMVGSTAVRGVDGKWSRVYSRALYGEARTAAAKSHAVFRALTREQLGWEWEPVDIGRGTAEVAGISPERIASLSTRTKEIDAKLAEVVALETAVWGEAPSDAAIRAMRQRITLDTRKTKHQESHATPAVIDAWREQLDTETGLSQEQRQASYRAAWTDIAAGGDVPALDGVALTVEGAAMEGRASATEAWIRATAWKLVPPSTPYADMERVHAELVETAKAEFVALTPPEAVQTGYLTENLALFTSRAELDLEHGAVQTVEASREHAAGGVGVVPLLRVIHGKDAEGRRLDDEQQAAVAHLCSAGLVKTMEARAGAGKTFTLAQATRAWQSQDQLVIVLGNAADTSRVAATEIAAATGGTRPESMTLAAFHGRGKTGMGQRAQSIRAQLVEAAKGPGAVVILDEAGTAGNRDFADLVAFAAEHGVAVRAVGDRYQQSAIDAGGLWAYIATREGVGVELEEVRRFHDPREADLSKRLAAGDPSVWAEYLDMGRIHIVADSEHAIAAAAETVASARAAGKDALAISRSNTDRVALADGIHLLDSNRDAGDLFSFGQIDVATGDTIRARRNDTRLLDSHGSPVFNGSTWNITQATADGLHAVRTETPDASVFFPGDYCAKHIEAEHAITVTRVQGATVDRSALVGVENMTLEQAYPALTRSRERFDLFIPAHTHAEALRMLEEVSANRGGKTAALDAYTRQLDEVTDHVAARQVEHDRAETQREQARQEQRQQEKARAELAATPQRDRPDWKKTDTEIKAEAAQLRAAMVEADQLPATQAALDAKRAVLDGLKTEHTRSQEAIVAPAASLAADMTAHWQQWKAEATDLVTQAEQPLNAAEDRLAQKRGDRFGIKSAQRKVEDAKEQLHATFPASGDPGRDYYFERDKWRARAVHETIQRTHGHETDQWRQTCAPQDVAVIDHQTQQHQGVEDLLSELHGTGYDHRQGDWTQHLPVAGWQKKQQIDPAAERWKSADPAAVIRSGQSWAAEIQARHKHTAAALNQADTRIGYQQRQLDHVPATAAKARERFAELAREWSIREAQPERYREIEQDKRTEARQLDAERSRQRQTYISHDYDHNLGGPDRGHGRSM